MIKLKPGLPGLLIASALAAGVFVTLRPANRPQWDTEITIPLIDAVYQPGAEAAAVSERSDPGRNGCAFHDQVNRVVELDQDTRDLIARCLVGGELRARLNTRRPARPSACLTLGPAGSAADSGRVMELLVEGTGNEVCQRHGGRGLAGTGSAAQADEPALALFRRPRLSASLHLQQTGESEYPGAVRVSSRLVLRLSTARRAGV